MKIIKITTENEITTLEFPEGDITSVNKRLYEMIGPKCELMEHVMPSRLYKILGASNRPKLYERLKDYADHVFLMTGNNSKKEHKKILEQMHHTGCSYMKKCAKLVSTLKQ